MVRKIAPYLLKNMITLIQNERKKMGCESIQIISKVTDFSVKELCEYIQKCSNVSPVLLNTQMAPSEYNFIYSDTKHVIELQVTDYTSGIPQLSCRFSLCHPHSIDKKFIEFTKSIANDLNLKIRIQESCQIKGDDEVFCPPKYDGYEKILQEIIKVKRKYWVADFGDETAIISCQEAIKKYILPKCKKISK